MTKDEVLRLALEALEAITRRNQSDHQAEIAEDAIACLRLVIDAENISSKPMAWEQFYPEMGKPKLAYLSPTELPENYCYILPQRTWIELTEDEIVLISADCAATHQHTDIHFARAIEAKLKEKNT